MVDAEILLAKHGGKLVRRIAKAENEVAEAMFEIVRSRRVNWSYSDWLKELSFLDSSNMTVEEWLPLNT